MLERASILGGALGLQHERPAWHYIVTRHHIATGRFVGQEADTAPRQPRFVALRDGAATGGRTWTVSRRVRDVVPRQSLSEDADGARAGFVPEGTGLLPDDFVADSFGSRTNALLLPQTRRRRCPVRAAELAADPG
jgi:hypothetical protein